MIILNTNQVWATRKVDFSNDSVKVTLVEDVYLALPSYFHYETGEDIEKMATKLNKSIYKLVQYPLYW